MQKKRTQRHPYERVATPYQIYAWMSPQMEHTIDAIRAEDAFSSKLGYEEHIPGQTRDWNEELQTTRELSRYFIFQKTYCFFNNIGITMGFRGKLRWKDIARHKRKNSSN